MTEAMPRPSQLQLSLMDDLSALRLGSGLSVFGCGSSATFSSMFLRVFRISHPKYLAQKKNRKRKALAANSSMPNVSVVAFVVVTVAVAVARHNIAI